MEKQIGRKAGTKNKTWCGIPISLYRRKKSELSKEEFEQWWFKKTGRPVDIRHPVKKSVQDKDFYISQLAVQLDKVRKELSDTEKMLDDKVDYIFKLENRSWIQRLFNLKP